MGVNRFIDYANPMYWAKMLRKGGIPKRKPYSFTVKINDYVIGEGTYNNTVDCTFDGELQLGAKGEKVVTGIYDTSKQVPQLIWTFEAGQSNYQGFSLSPSSKWKITAKDGTTYQGIIGDDGAATVEGLFTIERTDVKVDGTTLYYTKFVLKSKYDCVILDGCTIEFTPVFEKIQHAVLTASSKYEGAHTGLTGYDSDLWFYNKEAEKATKINEWIAVPGTGGDNEEFVYIKNNEYMKLNTQTDEETGAEYAATVKYTPSEGAETTIKVMPTTGNDNQYLIKLNFNDGTKEGYVNITPKDKSTVYVEVLYKEDTETFATITANVRTESQGKGLVQINSGDIGNTSTVYLVAGDTAAFKATPIGGAKFDGWYVSGGTTPISTANPYNVQVTEEMYGESGYSLYAKFSDPEATFTIKKKNYYDASITVQKQKPDGTFADLCTNYYDWSSSLPYPYGATLHKGDVLRVKMTYDDNGFENPKLYIGNQEIDYTQYATDGYKFMLDETTADAQYSLDLKDGYGAVFAEVYPNIYKWSEENPVKVSVYTMLKENAANRFEAAKIPFTDNRWSNQIDKSTGWQTKAINLRNDAGENIEYWVGFEFHPNTDEATGEEKSPFLSNWRDAVLAQSWGGAYKFVYTNTLSLALEGRYKFARLTCNLVNGEEKTAKLGTFKIASFATDEGGAKVSLNASAQLVMHDSQTLLSMFEESPKCIFDKTYDNLVRISSVSQTLLYEGESYTFDHGGCYADPNDLVKNWFIDGGGMGTVIFNADAIKSAIGPVITLHLSYNKTPQTEEEFLKSNIAEAKEKLADAIEALEKDYDDGKEDVIEETPVKDEPDTDEADVAEAVLATEPTEDKE